MTVREVWTPDESVETTGSGYAPDGALLTRDGKPASIDANAALRWSLLAGAACNDAALTHDCERWDIAGDPTEAAMLVVAAKAGLTPDRFGENLSRVETIPFSSERQYMVTQHRADHDDHDRRRIAAVPRTACC